MRVKTRPTTSRAVNGQKLDLFFFQVTLTSAAARARASVPLGDIHVVDRAAQRDHKACQLPSIASELLRETHVPLDDVVHV